MANEFVARNGLIAQNNSTVTGSLNVTGGTTGSLLDPNSLDSSNRLLQDSSTSSSIDWENRFLFDNAGNNSVEWSDRNLVDAIGIQSLTWETRVAYDNNNLNSVDWQNRQLIDSTGTNVILDWSGSQGLMTGSLYGTASWAENATSSSYAQTASYVETAQTASYVENAQTASYVTLAQTASYVETAQTASYVLQAISSSFATTASYVLNAISSSFSTTSSYSDQALSSSYALTASFALNGGGGAAFPYTGSAIISGSLEVTGSLSVNDGTYLKLDTSTHTLYDQIGAQSVNWNIRSLRDSNGNSSLNWDSRVAQDLSTITSIDWENRALFDLNTTQSVNWGERFLIDTYFANSVDWENRQLIDSTGANVILDWFNLPGTLYGTASWAESASRADSIPLAGFGFGEIQVNNGGVIGASNRIYIDLATSTLHTANGGILSATGSLLGTSSYADQALSSSYALTASFALNGGGGGPAFPYTGSALVTGSIGLTGSYSNFPLVITSSTNQTIDWSQSNTFNILLTGSMTVTWSNAQNGQTLNILVTQGTAPSGNLAIWPTVNTYFPGGLIPTQSETGGKKDIYTFICIGSDIYGNYIQNY